MARPKRGNFATGEAGLARYKEALRKYLAKTKKTTKPEVKKPVAKKPVAKKPATKKPAVKKPVAKKPPVKKPVAKKPVAKKPVAKKPVTKKPVTKKPAPKKTANNLKIKKATNTAVKTTKQAIKKATPVVKKAAKTVAKKAGEAKKAVTKKVDATKKALNKPSPTKRPTTRLQKLASKGNKLFKRAGKYTKNQVLPKAKKDLLKIGKGIAKDPRSLLKGAKGAGLTYAAERLTDAGMTRIFKRKGETVAQYKKRQAQFRKDTSPFQTAKRTIKGIRNVATGKNWYKDNMTTAEKKLREKRKNKPVVTKKTITKKDAPNRTSKQSSDLKIAKDRAKKAKGYNKEKLEREVRYQEKFGKQGRTWSNPVGAKGGGKPSTVKTDKTTSKPKKMSAIEKRNRQRFGDAHVDRLKTKNKEFQSIKRIKDRKERKKKREEYRQKYGR